ncbi:MAG: AI-2E family transporter [Bacteroidetes bacterium]|nr:AI-2E family transporter [Bacteroidota bacterium]
MNQQPVKPYPFYISFTFKLLMILLLGVLLTWGQNIIVPFLFSILLSILLLPLVNFMENRLYFPRSLAILATVVSSLLIIIGLIYFFSHQIAGFLKDIPSIRSHLEAHYETVQNWIQKKFHISTEQQTVMLNSASIDVKSTGTEVIGETFFTITHTFFYIIMIAIYTFLILLYRHMIRQFIIEIFNKDYETDVKEVLVESKAIVQRYIVGLITEMGIIAVANSMVLLLLGIKYAIFLGLLAAVLNIIPYIGIIAGMLFTSLVTLTTSPHLSDIVWIIISFEIIHFIDANFLMPKIVGSKVKINALVTIVGVVIGGSLLGLSGIFLALPCIAILKIIFDRIEVLKPWGKLMGEDTTQHNNKLQKRLQRIKLKSRKIKSIS